MKETKRPGQQLKGLYVQELLGVTNEESAMEIELRLIHPFKDHPFAETDTSTSVLQELRGSHIGTSRGSEIAPLEVPESTLLGNL